MSSGRSGGCQRTSASRPTTAPVAELDDRLVVEAQLAALVDAAEQAARSLRAAASARSAERKSSARPRDEAFAAYIATSALRSRSSAVSPSVPLRATPMLAAIIGDASPRSIGSRSASARRIAIDRARLLVADVVEQDRELVAAEAGGRVARSERGRDAPGGRHEDVVAAGVAERVVEDLEVVEVDEQDRRTAGRRGRGCARAPG